MKELLEDIRLNKVAKYLEKIQKGDLNEKLKYFRKLKKIKITKRIGIYLIENSIKDYNLEDELGGVNSSLIELCFQKYDEDYTEVIEKIFKDLSDTAKDRVLYLLTTTEGEKELKLYSELVVTYYKKRNIPIGDLANKPTLYPYLFPNLYKTLKYKIDNNNVLILISNYLSYGIIPSKDIKDNKKILTDNICTIFKKALLYKHKDTYSSLNDPSYKSLRYFLELAINIEGYISSKKTTELLEKLLKKHDNQIKLFILDNYARNNRDLKSIKFNEIAKDNASRYALFELLTVYDKLKLMPKKYLDQTLIAESDFYTNFVISSSYLQKPENIEFYKKLTIDEYDYYVFKFDYKYNYSASSSEYLTNYIINQVGMEKYDGEEVTIKFIGVSGGYDKDKELSTVVKHPNRLLIKEINENSDIDLLVADLVKEKEIVVKQEVKPQEEVVVSELSKKEIKKQNKKKKKEEKKLLKQSKKAKDEITTENLSNIKLSENMDISDDIDIRYKQSKIWTYIIAFLCFIFIGLFVYCVLYIYGIADVKDEINEQKIRTSKLNTEYKFDEIKGTDIFSKEENEYYVLLYTKPKDETYKYYYFINEYLKRKIKVYYVDLSKDENKFLFAPNELNFVVKGDRFLKVKDHEYEYFVDGDNYILNEMEYQIENIIQEEKKKESEKKKEETKKEEKNSSK